MTANPPSKKCLAAMPKPILPNRKEKMMKKKIWIPIVIAGVLLAALVVPIHSVDANGTEYLSALTYKTVTWNIETENANQAYKRTYFFPKNFTDNELLFEQELMNMEHTFFATVLEIDGKTVTVEPAAGSAILNSSDRVCFSTENLDYFSADVGDILKITYKGTVEETYPARVSVTEWDYTRDYRFKNYDGEQWLEKTEHNLNAGPSAEDLVITSAYADCFFASPVIPLPTEYKINGKLPDEWCVGDQVLITFENAYCDIDRIEADLVSVEKSSFVSDPDVCYKPVIYLYPTQETKVTVHLDLDGKLTCTYPAYKDGWTVTASPDGTLTDKDGKTYNYLYWEGETYADYDLSTGFCIKGTDTAAFLEGALADLGLTRREANEFIVYWLPLMEGNAYNLISFRTDAYTDAAKLNVSPSPDTVIRVFMTWQAAEEFVELPAQTLTAPARDGFTVVEWGGTELK